MNRVDETGWKLDGRSAWVWGFAGAGATDYRIRPSRAHAVIVVVLCEDSGGVLISDCLLAYDPLPFVRQNCRAHLLKSCREIEESKARVAVRLNRRVVVLLGRATTLKCRRNALSEHGFDVARGDLLVELDRLTAGESPDPTTSGWLSGCTSSGITWFSVWTATRPRRRTTWPSGSFDPP